MNYRNLHGFDRKDFEPLAIPQLDTEFLTQSEIDDFAQALSAPDSSPIVALNDWRPVHQRVRRRNILKRPRRKRPLQRSRDETREGYVYTLVKWPLLLFVLVCIAGLAVVYACTRLYIWSYERMVTWRGQRQKLRINARLSTSYVEWRRAAQELDEHLGNTQWKYQDDYGYYDSAIVRRVTDQLKSGRNIARTLQKEGAQSTLEAVRRLRGLVESSVKTNFVGVENPRLYSETYYGTKNLAQEFVNELHDSLAYLMYDCPLTHAEKYSLAKYLHTNFGRTALCLSGGASFAWYHLGVVRALLDASLLPEVVSGTSGGALVAAFVATRTDEELDKLLVPALAYRIRACGDSLPTWAARWWKTGARFDTLEWARQCSWFCGGSTTFKEAKERTGRILNVSCVPSDPHSPTMLSNYLTAPHCVIWSAVLASAAVPGILNPVVMMNKAADGRLVPTSFGHRWKDGRLVSLVIPHTFVKLIAMLVFVPTFHSRLSICTLV